MPNIKDDSTVEAIAREYCSNGRIKGKALISVGYGKGYADGRGLPIVFGNVRVKAAIARIDAKTAKKLDHNRDKAIKMLMQDLEYLTTKAAEGNIQAIQARAGIIRELNAISNLHGTNVNINDSKAVEHTPAELARLKIMADNMAKTG